MGGAILAQPPFGQTPRPRPTPRHPHPTRAAAQQPLGPGLPQPRLLIVTPAGGQAGTTVEVTLTGNDLDEAGKLLFSRTGLKAEPIAAPQPSKPVKPPQGGQPPLVATKFR